MPQQSIDIKRVMEQKAKEYYISRYGKETWEAKQELERKAGLVPTGGWGAETFRETEAMRRARQARIAKEREAQRKEAERQRRIALDEARRAREAAARERQLRAAKARAIERRTRAETFALTQQLQRKEITPEQYRTRLGEARLAFEAERAEAGIISAFFIPTRRERIRIAREEAPAVIRAIRRPEELTPQEIERLERRGLIEVERIERPPVEPRRELTIAEQRAEAERIARRPLTIPERVEFRGAEVLERIQERAERGLERVGVKLPAWLVEKKYKAAPITEFGKFVLFAPTIVTTAEIERAIIPRKAEVKFLATERKIRGDIIKSRIAYKTSEREVGRAVGLTKVKELSEGIRKAETIVIGIQKGRPVVKFPRARFFPKEERLFVGVQETLIKPARVALKTREAMRVTVKGFKQITRGVVKKATLVELPKPKIITKVEKFIGAGIGFTKKDLTAVSGRVLTEKGARAVSLGVIKRITPPKEVMRIITKRPKPVTALTQRAVYDVSTIIKAVVAKKPVTRVPVTAARLGLTGKALASLDIKPAKVKAVAPPPITKARLRQIKVPAVALAPKVRVRQRLRVIVRPTARERLKTAQLIRQASLIKQKQLQKLGLGLRLRLKSAELVRVAPPMIVPILRIPPPKIFIPIIPDFDLEKIAIPKRKRYLGREDAAYVAGYTARVLGIKKIVTPKQIRKMASLPARAIAIRPIPILKR